MFTRSTSFMMKLAFLIFLMDIATISFQSALLKYKITARFYYAFLHGSTIILALLIIAVVMFLIADHFTDSGDDWVREI